MPHIADLGPYQRSVPLKHWSVPVSLFMAPTTETRLQVLARLMPKTSLARHRTLADLHQARANELGHQYDLALTQAFQSAFGRDPRPEDYRITCIWRDDLADDDKARLRALGYPASQHRIVARAHRAAGERSRHD